MVKDYGVVVSTGRFRKLRAWNRRRNYKMREVRLKIRIYLAKIAWDKLKKTALDVSQVKTILLLRNEGTVGDVVVYTALIKCLHEHGFIVDCLLTRKSSPVLSCNPYVRNRYEARDNCTAVFLKHFSHAVPDTIISEIRSNDYDLIIDSCLYDTPAHRFKFFRDVRARSVLRFNKSPVMNYYSRSLPFLSAKDHVRKSMTQIAGCQEIKPDKIGCYELHLPAGTLEEVREFNNQRSSTKNVLINTFTGSPERDISQEQLQNITTAIKERYQDITIVLLDHRNELTLPLPEGVIINPFKTLHHVMALVHESDLVITPDTAIVHIAATWKKPLISVYKNVTDNNDLWAPAYQEASQIIIGQRRICDAGDLSGLILQEVSNRRLLG